jgi:alpha-L-fucosidase
MTKGGLVYAFFMGWPDNGSVMIKSLGSAVGNVEAVELLGFGKVEFTQHAEGLAVTLPTQKPCEHAYGLKISGGWRPFGG